MPYNPSKHALTNKSLGVAQGVPDGARTYFYDEVNFVSRPFVSTQEILDNFPNPSNRKGHPLYVVNTGGTLLNGVITGGTNEFWYFKDGIANNNLVKLLPGGGGDLLQGGNSFGVPLVTGTNDNKDYRIIRNNVVRVDVQADGIILYGPLGNKIQEFGDGEVIFYDQDGEFLQRFEAERLLLRNRNINGDDAAVSLWHNDVTKNIQLHFQDKDGTIAYLDDIGNIWATNQAITAAWQSTHRVAFIQQVNNNLNGTYTANLNHAVHRLTLTGNSTLGWEDTAPAMPANGVTTCIFHVYQDGSGSRTLSLTAGKFRGTLDINTAPNSLTIITGVYTKTDNRMTIVCNKETAAN